MSKHRKLLPAPVAVFLVLAGCIWAVAGLLLLSPAPVGAVPLPDYNEPNDSYETATALQTGEMVWGAVGPEATDKDYFYLDISASGTVSVEFDPGVPGRTYDLFLQAQGSSAKTPLSWSKTSDAEGKMHSLGAVGPGRFFAVVSLGTAEPDARIYTITVTYTSGGGSGGFTDVPVGSDFYQAITYLAQEGVVSGYGDGRFGVDDPVTRQQFAKMIVKAAGYPVSTADDCPFRDVDESYPGHYTDPNDPLYPDHYVAVAAAHNITRGTSTHSFAPYESILLAQVVTMVVRAGENLGIFDSPPHWYTPPFADFGEPHYSCAREGAAYGLFKGYQGPWGWFSPPATRGQCAFFIWKLMIARQGS